jgi:hypothetical protein
LYKVAALTGSIIKAVQLKGVKDRTAHQRRVAKKSPATAPPVTGLLIFFAIIYYHARRGEKQRKNMKKCEKT